MMNYKFTSKTLGLSLLIGLLMTTFAVVTAQAENLSDGGKPGLFVVEGTSILVKGATFTGSIGLPKLLVAGRNLEIDCSSGNFLEGKFNSDTELLAKIEFSGCEPREHKTGSSVPGCFIPGHTFTVSVVGLAKKHAAVAVFKPYILFEGDGSSTLGTIQFESGKGCVLPLKNELKGSLVAELASEERILQSLFFSEVFVQKLLGDKLLFGTFESFVEGTGSISLTGAHSGLKFGIV